jgi:hypothetical protein
LSSRRTRYRPWRPASVAPFLTDLAGTVYNAKLDGSGKKPVLVAQGNLTGIAYAEIP